MQFKDTIIQDTQSALEYDLQARKTHWLGPQVVFGLTYELVRPGESVLDIGIGSGLSSILFHRAGLRVYGLDGSRQILEVCAAKQFALELKQHDVRDLPLPYPDGFCDHVLSVAVLNSFENLDPLFGEIARIIKPRGILAFTVEDRKPGQSGSYPINRVAVADQPRAEIAVNLFRHREQEILQGLARHAFVALSSLEFVAFHYPAENRDVLFKAYVARHVTDI